MRSICLLGVQVAVEGKGWLRYMIIAYFERKGCVQRNLYLNCVSLYERFQKISYGSVSSACNRRRHHARVRRACKWNFLFYWRELQGAVAQRPISA